MISHFQRELVCKRVKSYSYGTIFKKCLYTLNAWFKKQRGKNVMKSYPICNLVLNFQENHFATRDHLILFSIFHCDAHAFSASFFAFVLFSLTRMKKKNVFFFFSLHLKRWSIFSRLSRTLGKTFRKNEILVATKMSTV